MKTKFLFPSNFRIIGYLLVIPGFILGYLAFYKEYKIPGLGFRLRDKDTLFVPAIENFTNEMALTLIIIGLLFIAFSKVKREDELTGKIRLNSLYWAILVNYGLYVVLILFDFACVWLTPFFSRRILGPMGDILAFTSYNLFFPLLLFIGRFYYLLYRNKNEFTVKPVHFLPYKPYHLLGKATSIVLILVYIIGTASQSKSEALENLLLLFPLSLMVWAYSKEAIEDEYINTIRLNAMQVAVYVNYVVLLLSNFLVYGIEFLMVQLINLVTIPFIFIVWFNYQLYRTNKQTEVKSILL